VSQDGLLIVGSWSSTCGGCGKPCDPYEKFHDTELPGYSRREASKGCGMEYTHVMSSYVGGGSEEAVKRMRPDLKFVEPGSGEWRYD
jgi:hypothetical protein